MRNKVILAIVFSSILCIFGSVQVFAKNTLTPGNAPDNYIIDIPDRILLKGLNKALGAERAEDEPITAKDARQFAGDVNLRVDATATPIEDRISDLEGIQFFVNMKSLDVGYNAITDFSPLSNLVQLERLNVDYNHVLDLSPLKAVIDSIRARFPESNRNDYSYRTKIVQAIIIYTNERTVKIPTKWIDGSIFRIMKL